MNDFVWKAAADRVVIQEEKRSETTAAGIVIPEKVRGTVGAGIVLAAGPDAHGVLPGDRALFLTKAFLQVPGEDGIWSGHSDSIVALQRGE